MTPDGDWAAAGAAVSARMAARKASTAALARATGLSETTIRALRAGRDARQGATLYAVSTGLGWPPGYLRRVAENRPEPAEGPTIAEAVSRIAWQLDALCRHLNVPVRAWRTEARA